MAPNKVAAATNGRALDWRAGAVGGIVGGFFYTLFVEGVNVAANGLGAFFQPFRQIGAVVLGPRALDAGYDVLTATITGTVLHLAIAVAFGVALAWMRMRLAHPGAGASTVLGLAAGLVFYALDVFVIFPAAFPWFLANDRLTQSIGHALFGAVTGAWLARERSA